MNANEVMANVALELTGHWKGEYAIVEPHDHLNMSQSTNDATIPLSFGLGYVFLRPGSPPLNCS